MFSDTLHPLLVRYSRAKWDFQGHQLPPLPLQGHGSQGPDEGKGTGPPFRVGTLSTSPSLLCMNGTEKDGFFSTYSLFNVVSNLFGQLLTQGNVFCSVACRLQILL